MRRQGRRVLERQGWRPAGRHEVAWDGRDASGTRIAPLLEQLRGHLANRDELSRRRRAGESTHPFHWAGFVAAGDWR